MEILPAAEACQRSRKIITLINNAISNAANEYRKEASIPNSIFSRREWEYIHSKDFMQYLRNAGYMIDFISLSRVSPRLRGEPRQLMHEVLHIDWSFYDLTAQVSNTHNLNRKE